MTKIYSEEYGVTKHCLTKTFWNTDLNQGIVLLYVSAKHLRIATVNLLSWEYAQRDHEIEYYLICILKGQLTREYSCTLIESAK